MRLCPSVEGSASPLITHRIGVDVCMARQRTFFHKCHRCIYRGQAANWEPAEAPLPTLPANSVAGVGDASHPNGDDVLVVEIAPPPVKKRAAKKVAKVVEAST
jgi:hypothetical protein